MENKCYTLNNLTDFYSYNDDGTACKFLIDDIINLVINESTLKNINSEYNYWFILIGFGFLLGLLVNILVIKLILSVYFKKKKSFSLSKQNDLNDTKFNNVELLIDQYVKEWERDDGELSKYQNFVLSKIFP